MTWVIYILSFLVIVLIYIVFNLYRKTETLTKICDNQTAWIEYVAAEVKETYTKLKTVDNRNLFDKDDDVGFVFAEILRLIGEIDDKINNYEEEIKAINQKDITFNNQTPNEEANTR